MMEKNNLTILWTPVLVEDFNIIASCYITHVTSPLR